MGLWWILHAENKSVREYSLRRLQFPITVDQVVSRTIVFEFGRGFAFQFGNNPLGEHLAQLDAPLIKGINVPNRALREHAVFVKRDELAKNLRREPVGENDIGRTVAIEDTMRHKRIWRALSFDFCGSFSKSESLGLGKYICQENVVVPAQRRERVAEGDEVARDEPRALMNQLHSHPTEIERKGWSLLFAPATRQG